MQDYIVENVKVWGYRKELLQALREMCKRNGWSFRNPGGDEPKIDRGEDMNDFYASAKVTVGDSLCLKKEDSKYWSDRVPEATGRGGFLIMPRVDALDKIYKGFLPMYDWGDWQGLESMIHLHLTKENMSDIDETKFSSSACQSITSDNHTYVNRVQKILEVVNVH